MASLIAEGASTTLSVATRAVQSIGNLKTRMEVDALKKKADKYFLVGKLQEAKDIYNRAEKLDPFHIQVLMNRAACHLAMRDSAACLQDCNNALNLLSKGKPKSDSSTCALPDGCTKRKWQVFLLCRRAAAKELAHDFRGALCDLEDAKKIARNDNDLEGTKEIARNIDDLKAKMNSINTKVKTKGNQSLSAMLGLSFM
jgi:tetratricopeptide (TPR) repeat protein